MVCVYCVYNIQPFCFCNIQKPLLSNKTSYIENMNQRINEHPNQPLDFCIYSSDGYMTTLLYIIYLKKKKKKKSM